MTIIQKYSNTSYPAFICYKMLLYTCLFFLLVSPVLTMTHHNMDARRAVETKEVVATKAANSNTNNNSQNDKPSNGGQEVGNQNTQRTTVSTISTTSGGKVNCSLPKYINYTLCNDDSILNFFKNKMSANSGMLFRTMYVLLAVTGVVIVYFAIKAIRARRRRSKSRKYGIITKQGDHGDMEMEPLGDGADEDDDYTVFEMSRRK